MSDLSYVYKPKALSMGLAFVFFAACAATSLNSALTNDRGLIINGLINLDPGQATIFYWAMTAIGACMSGFGLIGVARAMTGTQRLTVNETGIRLPKSGFSDTLVTVAFAHVKDLVRQQVKSQHFLVIHHIGGKTTVASGMLPNRAAFDEVCRVVTERVIQARRG